MDYIEIKAPAKINIGLNIISRRNDGYHNLETIFYPLSDLYDTIYITKSNKFSFESDIPELNTPDNLIVKAKELLEYNSGKKLTAEIKLKKIIPMGGGLGGGSSDAAAVLLSLNEMFNLKYSIADLQNFGLRLGSDVPFFILNKPAFGESRGEALTRIDLDITFPILVINPGVHISTREAYSHVIPKAPVHSLKGFNMKMLESDQDLAFIQNDFEEYVFKAYPEIGEIKKTLYSNGARLALMSGSGSTVFGVFRSMEEAENGKKCFPEEWFRFVQEGEEY